MSQLRTIQDDAPPGWLPQLAGNKGPRFLQIADALQAAVAEGSLKPGDRLPPQRQLAARLDVDLRTVTRAYDEARRRKLLEGRGARGTCVAAPKVASTAVLDLSMNTPPPPDGVDFDDLLKQGLSQILMTADNVLLMNYHPGGGSDAAQLVRGRRRGHRRHAGRGIRHRRRIGERHPHIPGQHGGPRTPAGRPATPVAPACAAAGGVRRGRGLSAP